MTVQLTQEQWYDKIKTLVPSWMWQREDTIRAYAMALSKACEQLQIKTAEHAEDTFIMQSAKGTLDSHGDERSTDRLDNELDPDFAVRVQSLFNQSNIPALITTINKVLVSGAARIQEDYDSVPFCGSVYASRAALFLEDPITNTFSIIVDKQTHAPFTFLSREYFCDREGFIGTDVSLDRVFTSIQKIADDNKALGTFYRIFELLS